MGQVSRKGLCLAAALWSYNLAGHCEVSPYQAQHQRHPPLPSPTSGGSEVSTTLGLLCGGSEVDSDQVPLATAARPPLPSSPSGDSEVQNDQVLQRGGPKRPSPPAHQKQPRGRLGQLAMQAFGPFPRLGAKLAGSGPVLYREPLHARSQSKPVRRIYERRSEEQTRD